MYRKPRVLIIDDWDMKLTMLVLERFGFEVFHCENGFDALALLDEMTYDFRLPDIILMDTMMPGMSGFEVMRRLKANLETRHIPLVLWYTGAHIDWIVEAYESGCVAHLDKLTRPKELVDALWNLIRN